MGVQIGIDAAEFRRSYKGKDTDPISGLITERQKDFRSMIGCAVATDNPTKFNKLYEGALKKALVDAGIKPLRGVLCSNEILTLTEGDTTIHEKIFEAIEPSIEKLNLFFSAFNTQEIPKIKVYGKLQFPEYLTLDEFYNAHLKNCFPHLCIWKMFGYINWAKAHLYVDFFQGEITEAWEEIAGYDKIDCYFNGDMVNPLISSADLICRLMDKRLGRRRLFLNKPNLSRVFPEVSKDRLHLHRVGNYHLPKVTMIHTKKIPVHHYIQQPVYNIYVGKNFNISKPLVLKSVPKFIERVRQKGSSMKFFTEAEVHKMKDGDALVCLDKKLKPEVDLLVNLWKKERGLKIKAHTIEDFS